MSRFSRLPGWSLAKRSYDAAFGPLLSAAFTFERRRIEAELGQRMDAVMQALHRRQEELETDLLRLKETVDRLDSVQTRAELDDLKRDIQRLVDGLARTR